MRPLVLTVTGLVCATTVLTGPFTAPAQSSAATHATWIGFFVTWISMLFAAGGALAGAGPMFRAVTTTAGRTASDRRDDRSYGATAAHA